MSDPWGWLPVTRTAMRREIAAVLAHARGHAAGLLAHHDRQIRHRLAELERTHTAHVETTDLALIRLEDQMTNAEQAAYERLAQITGLIKAEFASLKAQIAAVVADQDAAIAAGVATALGEDSAADAARLEGLIAELETVLPVAVPEVPVPAPGEHAEIPAAPVDPDVE